MTERFSPRVVVEQKMGKAEKNTKTAKSTKRAKSKGKYTVHIAPDGTKHMILNG
jgi:hypothetical protein